MRKPAVCDGRLGGVLLKRRLDEQDVNKRKNGVLVPSSSFSLSSSIDGINKETQWAKNKQSFADVREPQISEGLI